MDFHSIVGGAVCRLLLALYEAKQIGLAAMKVGVLKVPRFGVRIALEYALLEMGYFVETIHVELPDERGELLVFEPAAKDFPREPFMV